MANKTDKNFCFLNGNTFTETDIDVEIKRMQKIERTFNKKSKIDKQKSCFQHNGKRFYNPIADEKLGRLNNSGLNERK